MGIAQFELVTSEQAVATSVEDCAARCLAHVGSELGPGSNCQAFFFSPSIPADASQLEAVEALHGCALFASRETRPKSATGDNHGVLYQRQPSQHAEAIRTATATKMQGSMQLPLSSGGYILHTSSRGPAHARLMRLGAIGSPDECAAECAANLECTAFAFHLRKEYCELYNSIGIASANGGDGGGGTPAMGVVESLALAPSPLYDTYTQVGNCNPVAAATSAILWNCPDGARA
jgi:hypothetical protein